MVIAINSDVCLDAGFWGSMIALVAKAKGVEGVVLDGGCRDVWEIQRIKFPVFSRGIGRTEVIGRLEIRSEDVNVQVSVGGVTVNSYDMIVGDDDGLELSRKVLSVRFWRELKSN